MDILVLAPALDTRTGHPAIWEKLLAHCIVEGTQEGTTRIYADVPDQPLLVNTFAHVGFGVLRGQAFWRLAPDDVVHRATNHGANPGAHDAVRQSMRATKEAAHVRLAQQAGQ